MALKKLEKSRTATLVLRWPLLEKELKDRLNVLSHLKHTLNTAMQADIL